MHGAFADSSSWNGVIERLQAQGYPVVAAANPLRGLASDSAYVRSVLDSVKGPIVLAGHSYGGAVISSAAAADPDVKALVYIAAVTPEVGENTAELVNKFPGNTLGGHLEQAPFPLPGGGEGTDLYVAHDAFGEHFAGDVPAKIAALMAATQRPAATAALEEKATHAAWKTIPSWPAGHRAQGHPAGRAEVHGRTREVQDRRGQGVPRRHGLASGPSRGSDHAGCAGDEVNSVLVPVTIRTGTGTAPQP